MKLDINKMIIIVVLVIVSIQYFGIFLSFDKAKSRELIKENKILMNYPNLDEQIALMEDVCQEEENEEIEVVKEETKEDGIKNKILNIKKSHLKEKEKLPSDYIIDENTMVNCKNYKYFKKTKSDIEILTEDAKNKKKKMEFLYGLFILLVSIKFLGKK